MVSGIVEFADKRDAEYFIDSLNGKKMEGNGDRRMVVEYERRDRDDRRR
jgi:hypothetical protein